jgi:hypothetical protein
VVKDLECQIDEKVAECIPYEDSDSIDYEDYEWSSDEYEWKKEEVA